MGISTIGAINASINDPNRSLNGKSFGIFAQTTSSSVNGAQWIQMFNPSASGKTIFIQAARLYTVTAAAYNIFLGLSSSKLALTTTLTIAPTAFNKLFNGPSSIAQFNGGTVAAGTITGATQIIGSTDLYTNYNHQNFIMSDPIAVPPGYAFHAYTQNISTSSISMTVQFEWFEQ
jgi:hypothetical protein